MVVDEVGRLILIRVRRLCLSSGVSFWIGCCRRFVSLLLRRSGVLSVSEMIELFVVGKLILVLSVSGTVGRLNSMYTLNVHSRLLMRCTDKLLTVT